VGESPDGAFKPGRHKTGGRQKGTPNKATRDIHDLLDQAAIQRARELAKRTRKKLGSDDEALVYYLSRIDEEEFHKLYGKRIPRAVGLEKATEDTLGDLLAVMRGEDET